MSIKTCLSSLKPKCKFINLKIKYLIPEHLAKVSFPYSVILSGAKDLASAVLKTDPSLCSG